ncbi:TPA: hypothetical protein UL586_004337 [Klebsiella pneumoniae]|nr:hypothetical protein [Klebsiella pneumoniae]HBZ0713603.1 hypothetical protein [Klebsiella pneumoniae]HBZ0786044.1 hypothetical protein [Klebsiella pneumoniae]HEL7936860.1 hypothetical protein [Klebsiella pneumoniae]
MSISIILERALPLGEDILSRIHSGELVVSGGTIRDQAGRIVKHLVFPSDRQNNNAEESFGGPNSTTDQNYQEIMHQLSNQTAMLAAVNIISARNTNEIIGKKLEEISDKLDILNAKLSYIQDNIIFDKLMKFSEIKSSTLSSIEEAIYANETQRESHIIRLHIMPLRKNFYTLNELLVDILNGFSNKKIIDCIQFIMLIADLKNKASFVLGQTHIRLGEEGFAQNYFNKNIDSNNFLRSKLEVLVKTGALSPHVITEKDFLIFKNDIETFKNLEIQSQLLSTQNQLSLELRLPHYQLLNNSFKTIHMLDPITLNK